MTFLAFTGLVNFLCSSALGILVYKKCPRRSVGIAYGVLNVIIAGFSAFYFLWQCSSTATWGLFNLRMLSVWAIWINQALLYFNAAFLGVTTWRRRILWASAVINVVFSILEFTPYLFSVVIPRYNLGFWPESVSGLFVLYLAWWHGELIYAFADLIYSRRRLEGHKRDQVSYMIAAFAIGYMGGITNWPMWFGVHLAPYPNILISAYTLIVAYAMVKHHLMDITIVIRRTLLYSLVSAALAAVYVATITVLAQLLEGRYGSTSNFSAALAAILITLLFNPLRLRVQRAIDRFFPRERIDPGLLQEAAGGFAHEMKRPLTKISFPAQLALQEVEDVLSGQSDLQKTLPKVIQRLHYIINESLEAGYMIEAIRELSLSSASPFELVDLSNVVQRALGIQKDLLEKYSVSFEVEMASDLPKVNGRAKQLEIVFINLVKNAAEAMGEVQDSRERTLHIEGSSNHQDIIIRITDTGPGIKPEDVGKILQPNFTTKGPHGTGIGLYLSRQIVLAHGGSIEVSSSNGTGATFTIKLPKSH